MGPETIDQLYKLTSAVLAAGTELTEIANDLKASIDELCQVASAVLATGTELMEAIDDLTGEEPEPDLDTLYLARAIQGEGAGAFGIDRDALGLWIGHTAMNRLEKGWWDYESMIDVVTGAFHGYVNATEPAPWAIHLARQAINRQSDIADGALFMLSGADLKNHGWSSETTIQFFKHEGRAMYFFRLWPGD